MRYRHRLIAALLLTAGILVGPALGEAGKPCVGYEIRSPGGSSSNTFCSPVSDPFGTQFTSRSCSGVPPLGTEVCTISVIYLP